MAGDPYLDSVVLGLHMDGANGSTVFVDTTGKSVSVWGTAAISSEQSKFGGGSLKLGTALTNKLTVPADSGFALGGGAFTIEFVLHPTADNINGQFILTAGGGGTNAWNSTDGWHWAVIRGNAGVYFQHWVSGTTGMATDFYPAPLNTWTHVEYTYDGSVVRAFHNGVLMGSVTAALGVPSTTPRLAVGDLVGAPSAWDNAYTGYIDEVRITKGVARHTASFTPPAQAFPNGPTLISGTTKDATGAFAPRAVRVYRKSDGAMSGAVTSHATTGAFSVPALDGTPHYAIAHDSDADPYWDKVVLATHFDTDSVIDPHISSVVLGLHMEGANNSTTFVDVTGKTVTAVGNAKISTARSKFGNSSAAFDGSGDYLTLPNTSDFDFPGAFTIDGWVYLSAYGASWSTFVSRNVDVGTKGYRMLLNSSADNWLVTLYGVDDTLYTIYGGVVATGGWYHLELGFDGTSYRTFTNGVLNNTLAAPAPKTVGTSSPPYVGSNDTNNWFLNGHIDDLRFTKGVCRHTATFTPPAVPFGSFKDLTGKDLMCNGAPSISTAIKKYGDAALQTSGNVSGVVTAYSLGFEFGVGDFTIEAWVYPTATAPRLILSRRRSSAHFATVIYTDASNRLNALFTADGTAWIFGGNITSASPLPANAWSHFAVLRINGMFVLAINGVFETRMHSALPLATSSGGFGIGCDMVGASTDFLGCIDDVRITKGVARYVTDFTPPERSFPGAMGAGTRNALIFDDLTPV